MKATITFLLVSISYGLFSQNFEAFQFNQEYHYAMSSGTRDYLFSVKMDSLEQSGTDSILLNYEQVPLFFTDMPNPNIAYKCLSRDSWIGKSSISRADGTQDFITASDDTIRIKTRAGLGESWQFCPKGSAQYFEAVVTNVYETTVLGVLDSVKEITINLYDLSHVLQSSLFNGKTILLSKAHGPLQVYDFYNFPQQTKELTLIGRNLLGVTPLKQEELYQFEVGDYLVYNQSSTGIVEFRIITSKTLGTNTVSYQFEQIIRTGNNYTYNPSASFTHTFTADNYRLTGQFSPFANDMYYPFDGMVINYLDNGKKHLSCHSLEPFDGICWYEDFYNGQRSKSVFRENYGMLEDDNSTWYDAYDEMGNWYTEYTNYLQSLYYYVPQTGTSYGTLIKPFINYMISADKKASCDGIIQFQLTDLGYDSLLWHFGDGTTSTELQPQHIYTEGSYTVTLDLYSKFGDENLTYFNTIVVGENFLDHPIKSKRELLTSCNTYRFYDNTDTISSRLWTFPDGSTSTAQQVNYTFDAPGDYTVELSNTYAFCSRSMELTVTVETLNPPLASNCPISYFAQGMYYFEMNGKQLKGSDTYSFYNNALGDSLIRGCNFWNLYSGMNTGLTTFLGYYELIEVGWGLYDPWYTGSSYELWIDYNNDGVFQTDEKVTSGYCGSGYDIVSGNLFGTSNFIVPTTAVKNTLLRMRLVEGFEADPCDPSLNRYDFSAMISEPVGLEEKENFAALQVAPNPVQGTTTLKLNNNSTVAKLDISLQNLLGEEVYRYSERNTPAQASKTIEMAHLAKGVYFLNVTVDGKTESVKVVKN